MKRLTNKNASPERTTIGMPKAVACYWKLKQYEDLEEELGIELSVLFKAFKQEYIFGFTNDYKKYIYEFPIKDIEINVHEKTLDVYWECSEDLCKQFKLKDYGKTWALTREELEK